MNELTVNLKNVTEQDKKTILEIIKRSEKKKKFIPKHNENYFYIDLVGEIRKTYWPGVVEDIWLLETGNVFETEEEAEEGKLKIIIKAAYTNLAEESWENEEIDWNNKNQHKWFAFYTHQGKTIILDYNYRYQTLPNNRYFKTDESLKKAIQEIGEKNITKYVIEVEV